MGLAFHWFPEKPCFGLAPGGGYGVPLISQSYWAFDAVCAQVDPVMCTSGARLYELAAHQMFPEEIDKCSL